MTDRFEGNVESLASIPSNGSLPEVQGEIVNVNQAQMEKGASDIETRTSTLDRTFLVGAQSRRKLLSVRELRFSSSRLPSSDTPPDTESVKYKEQELEEDGGSNKREVRNISAIDPVFPVEKQPGRNESSTRGKRSRLVSISMLKIFEIISNFNFLGLFGFALWSTALTAIVLRCDYDVLVKSLGSMSTSRGVGIMGSFLSFALVFRTNICYNRWWEARCGWGKLVGSTMHCAQQGESWIADEELSRRFIIMIIVFAYASKALLRGNSLNSEEEEGDSLVSSGLIQQEELYFMHSQSGMQPYYCIDAIREIMNVAWSKKDGCTLNDPGARGSAYRALEISIDNLAGSIGSCIKVKATGLPISYNMFMKTSIVIFFAGASLAWSTDLKWFTPAIICTMYCMMELTIIIGNNMQTPFGSSFSSLPLQKYCVIIENEISAIEERNEFRTYLTTGTTSVSTKGSPKRGSLELRKAYQSRRRASNYSDKYWYSTKDYEEFISYHA